MNTRVGKFVLMDFIMIENASVPDVIDIARVERVQDEDALRRVVTREAFIERAEAADRAAPADDDEVGDTRVFACEPEEALEVRLVDGERRDVHLLNLEESLLDAGEI